MLGRRSKEQQEPIRQARNTIEEQGYAFRRSRTLTGSSSTQVSTVSESRAQIKSPRLRAQELKAHRRKLAAGFLGACVVMIGCIWLLDQYTVGIAKETTPQEVTKPIEHARYQAAVSKYFASHPFERFRFALNQSVFEQYMKAQLPEIQSISLENAPGLVSTSAYVVLRQPVAVWTSDSERLYVDHTGATFAQNYFFEPTVTIEDQSGVSASDQTRLVASSRLLTFAGQLVSGIDASGVGNVSKVVIPLGALRQLDVTLAGKEYRIKTHMDRDPVGQVFDVVSAVKYFDGNQIKPEYIDVRVEGKAFYR